MVHKDDACKNYPTTNLRKGGFFAPVETSLFRHILKDGCKKLDENGRPPLVVDVGGNIGYLLCHQFAGLSSLTVSFRGISLRMLLLLAVVSFPSSLFRISFVI